jgi:hypothetical protein
MRVCQFRHFGSLQLRLNHMDGTSPREFLVFQSWPMLSNIDPTTSCRFLVVVPPK